MTVGISKIVDATKFVSGGRMRLVTCDRARPRHCGRLAFPLQVEWKPIIVGR